MNSDLVLQLYYLYINFNEKKERRKFKEYLEYMLGISKKVKDCEEKDFLLTSIGNEKELKDSENFEMYVRELNSNGYFKEYSNGKAIKEELPPKRIYVKDFIYHKIIKGEIIRFEDATIRESVIIPKGYYFYEGFNEDEHAIFWNSKDANGNKRKYEENIKNETYDSKILRFNKIEYSQKLGIFQLKEVVPFLEIEEKSKK